MQKKSVLKSGGEKEGENGEYRDWRVEQEELQRALTAFTAHKPVKAVWGAF